MTSADRSFVGTLCQLGTRGAAVLFGLLICAIVCFGQSGAGSIQGTVTDPTGAVVAGAKVHVVNVATSVVSDTTANGVGFYQVPNLFTGTYSVEISAPSMKTFDATVELLVNQNVLINAKLVTGAVTEHVEVSSDVVQLTTPDSGTVSSTLENGRINQLPMNGRMLLTLAGQTTPGLDSSGGMTAQRLNGLLPQALEFVADGGVLTNRQAGGENQVLATLPDPDSVQEVRLETTGASAQYATPGTAVITTKSGTNVLHGSFFETARNNVIGNARSRANGANYVAPHLVRNEFGASAGGPIRIPGLYNGKDRSFWFFAFERYSLSQNSPALATVPTVAMRNGDFSNLYNSSHILQVLYDPATTAPSTDCNGTGVANAYCRTPFSGNQIPGNRLNPLAKRLYATTPQPTTSDNPLAGSNYYAPDNNYEVVPTVTFRLDHNFTQNDKVYLRYTQQLQTDFYAGSTAGPSLAAEGLPAGLSGQGQVPSSNFATAIGYTHIFSPTFFSETIISQQWQSMYAEAGGDLNHNWEKDLGLPNNFGEPGFPNMGASLLFPYGGNQTRFGMSELLSNLDENLTKTVGLHQMQFGGRYRHERFGNYTDHIGDSIPFTNNTTGLLDPTTGTTYGATPNTGNANADFYLGSPASYQVILNPPYAHIHDMEFDAYFQDNYRISRNLTANIGLRWEAHPAMWVKYGLMNGFDLKNDAIVLAVPPSTLVSEGYTTSAIITNLQNLGVKFETPSQAGYPDTLIKNYNFNFSPRIGLAYQLFGGRRGTVLRGAYGRYIFPIPTRNGVDYIAQNNPLRSVYTQNYNAANQAPDSLPNYTLRAPQTVFMGVNSANVVNSSTINAILPGISQTAFAPNYAPEYTTETNLTLEQALKGNSALRVSWLWTHGANLDEVYYFNYHPSSFVWEMNYGIAPPNGSVIGSNQYASTATGPYDQITYGSGMQWQAKDGWSNDNSLQVNYQRLYHHGSAFQILYVWSRPFRLGGNTTRDGLTYNAAAYLGALPQQGTMTSPFGTVITPSVPPARPAGTASFANWKELRKYEEYKLDTAIPQQHIQFNGILDVPVGRGKRFLGNSNRLVNELVGGFQIAGSGNVLSQHFQPVATNWGPVNPIKMYKHGAKVKDCRSGVCHAAYEWFNGYLAPGVINAATNGISGLPSNYAAYESPIDTTVGTANYNTNNVNVTLKDGSVSKQSFSPGPVGNNPYSNVVLNGPKNWTVDLSVFKVFPITERVNIRVNVDAFNSLNMQGFVNPNTTDGVESLLSSYNQPRQLQLTARLTF